MKPLIIANWKMNPQTISEAKQLFNLVKKGMEDVKKAEVVICPPFVYLPELRASVFARGYGRRRSIALATERGLAFGSQDCFWEEAGAFTGEISSIMLKNLGVKYVILGHSERRKFLGETDEIINKKIKAAVKAKLNPILCIGETKEERSRGEAPEVLKRQIEFGLKGVSGATLRGVPHFVRSSKLQVSRLCIAYEPVWAIGTGNPCDIEEAQKMGLLIRKIISGFYNLASAKNIQILYGGSVNSKNAKGYVKEAGLQGLLVGGASLNPKEFVKIVESVI